MPVAQRAPIARVHHPRTSRAFTEALEARILLTRFAVIGDYSSDVQAQPTLDVANRVKSWNPDFIATVGDNNYPDGAASTIDGNIGRYYHDYIFPYTGSFGAGSPSGNRYWPAIGNHDWNTDAGYTPYTNYFTLPGNERYYTNTHGNVQLFIVNSDENEPDGTSPTSIQGQWLQSQLAASTAKWKLVFFHHPPFTSGNGHGPNPYMDWPFQQWGATAVLSGHEHVYERLTEHGIPYFVDGLGGESIYGFGTPAAGSQVRYEGDYGGMLIDADNSRINFQFITRTGVVIDNYSVYDPALINHAIIAGATWKYLDNGSNQGTAWRNYGFSDSTWASGAAQLGYGDGDEATVVSYGGNSGNKFVTTYFRKNFTIANPQAVNTLDLSLLRDDGAVVYLNGVEVYRSNMPTGTIAYTTLAASGISGAAESAFTTVGINPLFLNSGTNTLAVEIHQAATNDPDISFDASLDATLLPAGASLPAAPSGLTAVAVGFDQINLSWINTASGVQGFKIDSSTDGVNFSPRATVAANATTFSDTGLNGGTKYYYRVRSYNAWGDSRGASAASATTPSSLPVPWVDNDVGAVGVPGSGSYAGGVFTIKGSGVDVWGTADSFNFVNQQLTGNWQLTARVASVQQTATDAFAGVMFRETLAANSKEACMIITATIGAGFVWRSTTGGTSSVSTGAGVPPYWVRITRSGNVFTGFRSSNGTTWNQVGTATITMASTIYAGLLSCSKVNSTLCTSTIDNVALLALPSAADPTTTSSPPWWARRTRTQHTTSVLSLLD